MPRNRLPRVMKHYSPAGRRNHGRLLKRLLVTWVRNGSTSDPTPWQIYDDDYEEPQWSFLNYCLVSSLNITGKKHFFFYYLIPIVPLWCVPLKYRRKTTNSCKSLTVCFQTQQGDKFGRPNQIVRSLITIYLCVNKTVTCENEGIIQS